MFCPHCGNQMEDDGVFCSACGGKVDAGAGTPPPAEQAPVSEQPEYTGDFTLGGTNSPFSESAFATPEFDAPRPEKPKKERKKLSKPAIIGLIACSVVVVAVVTLGIVFRDWIRGTWIRTFGSDEEYFEFVEEQQAKTYAKAISAAYSAPMNLFEMDTSGTSTVSFKVDEKVIREFLSMATGRDFDGDLSFLNELQLDTTYNITSDGMSSSVGLVISGQTIATANMTLSYEDEMLYISIPELSDKVMTMRLSRLSSGGQDMQEVMEMLEQVQKLMPSEKDIEKLLERYIGAALGAADDVTMKSTTLNIGDVSQDCRKITVNVSMKTGYDALIAVLKEAKKDKDLENLFRKVLGSDLVKEAVGQKISSSEISQAYKMIQQQIDVLVDELQSEKKRMSGDDSFTEPLFTLIDYVDGSHDVIGRELRVEDETVFFYGTAKSGKEVGTKIELPRQFFGIGIVFEGSGTKSGDKVTGEYTLRIEESHYEYTEYYNEEYGYYDSKRVETVKEHEVCTLKLTDFDTKALEEGKLIGKVRISPSAELMEELLGSSLASVLKPSVEFEFQSSGNTSNTSVSLLMGDSVMLSIGANTSVAGGKKLTTPSGSQVDMQYGQSEFVRSINFDQVRNALRKANLPGEYLSYAEEILDRLERELSYDYSYGYGYGYDY